MSTNHGPSNWKNKLGVATSRFSYFLPLGIQLFQSRRYVCVCIFVRAINNHFFEEAVRGLSYYYMPFLWCPAWLCLMTMMTGVYVGSGSSSNGTIFIWNATTGKLVQKLEGGHTTGVCGISWGRGDSSSYPQVASVDKIGTLILWSS